jgi:quercetin dioxygenase-like cupin family protein
VIHGSLENLELAALPGRRAADPLPASAAEGVAVRLVEVTEPRRRPHRHPASPEVIHVLAGHGEHWQEGERLAVGPGDIVLVPVGRPHVTLAKAGETVRLLCFFPIGDVAAGTEELGGDDVTISG